jgi:lysozyme
MMTLFETCLGDLRRHEAMRLKPYRDTVGKLTIGVGRNLDDNGIRAIEADFMLRNDVDEVMHALYRRLPWISSLTQDRQAVLINMSFNLGLDGLLQFKNTLAAIEQGNYDNAAQRMLQSKWATQVKGRATELADRMRKG